MNLINVAPGGVPNNLYATTTLVNNTAKTVDVTVPEKEIWRVKGVLIENGDSVVRLCRVILVDLGSVNEIYYLHSANINAGNFAVTPSSSYPLADFLLDSYQIIRFYWAAGGASAGGASRYNIISEKWGKHDPV